VAHGEHCGREASRQVFETATDAVLPVNTVTLGYNRAGLDIPGGNNVP
jgi:hypothetical protein